MRPLPFLAVCVVSAAFIWLCVYATNYGHEKEHGYRRSDVDKVSRLLDIPKPVVLFRTTALAELYPDYHDNLKSMPQDYAAYDADVRMRKANRAKAR